MMNLHSSSNVRTNPNSRGRLLSRTGSALGLGAMLSLGACSGGGSDPNATPGTSGDFVVLRTEPANNGRLFLNESIAIDFSNPVNLASADLNTVSFQVFDLNGVPLTEQPQGTFAVGDTPGDSLSGRRLLFLPRFPTNDTFDNGGFRPGRRYIVQLTAGANVTTLSDSTSGRDLARPASFQFSTADGTTPFELFRDTKAGGPRRSGFAVSPVENGVAPLSLLGQASVEVRLDFDQPLNPSTVNVPTNIQADPTRRAGQDKGRIYLEYDEPNDPNIWIPAKVEIRRNTLAGATVVLSPIGVLPNNAEVRVIVADAVEDMAGESNVSDTAYADRFGTFNTSRSLELQYDALVEKFNVIDSTVDFDAPLLEPLAKLTAGGLTSTFAFDGQASTLDYVPSSRETIIDTNFAQLAPLGSEPIQVSGGQFNFRSVTIPVGRTVRGVGPNPMVWLVTGDFRVDGELNVNGGAGDRVNTLNSANFPTPGGISVCGGGGGGKGSPNAGDRSVQGQAGFGPGQRPARGGFAGRYYCGGGAAACTGAGGGGGSYSTQGDPEFNLSGTTWNQWRGTGGTSCATVTGAPPGPRPFIDSRNDNDFWGNAVKVFDGVRVRGELLLPLGGAGGGGGGDKTASCATTSTTFVSDEKGGGGGAGGGVLIIQALGKIIIGPQGVISADGGLGGGGEQAGANNKGGGGGAGSGGMVILMAATGVEIERHGNTYGQNDNAFAISADGNIGEQGEFQNAQILDKYQGFIATRNVNHSAGGFGGMGIVQIMVPAGDDTNDNTGSFLDDRIRFTSNGGEVSMADKIALLGWRGWAATSGGRVDSLGNPINIGDRIDDKGNLINVTADGDIRPHPILLPLPFGAEARAQSRWIDLGAVVRRTGTTGPRTINLATAPQPDFEFAGANTGGAVDGFVTWEQTTGARTVPVRIPDTAFTDAQTGQTFAGSPAYRIRVASPLLAAEPDHRYAHHRAEITDALGSVLGDFRVVGHTRIPGVGDSFVYLDPETVFPTGGTQVRIVAKFFEVLTDGQIGLGAYNAVIGRPRANVRIGFAFHVDPTDAASARYPATGFSADIAGLVAQMRANNDRPGFVKWDVLFQRRFGDSTPISPNLVEQQLQYLVLPFGF